MTRTEPALLVLRALGMGDLLTAVPALRALRRAYPHHRLRLATPGWLAPLVELIDAVDAHVEHDALKPLAVSPADIDVAVNLHGKGPASHHVLDALGPASRIGHAGPGWRGPPWRDDLAERERWCAMLGWHAIAADPTDLSLPAPPIPPTACGTVVVHPSAAYGAKRWPPQWFAAVARELASAGLPVVVTGSARERPLAARVAADAGLGTEALLAGRLGPGELAALVSAATVLVCGDTGIAHLATAYRTPSVVLFGPVPASRWGPPSDGPHRTLSADECRNGNPFADAPDPALLGVSVDDVLQACESLAVR